MHELEVIWLFEKNKHLIKLKKIVHVQKTCFGSSENPLEGLTLFLKLLRPLAH